MTNNGDFVIISDGKTDSKSLYAPIYNNEPMTNMYSITPNEYKQLSDSEYEKHIENGLFYIKKNNVRVVFDPSMLPVEERVKQMLIYWIELFAKKVPVKADFNTINANKSITFRYEDIATEFGITYKQAKKVAIDSARALSFTGLEWKDSKSGAEMHFNVLQDYTTWREDSKLGRGCMNITFGEKFAYALPRMSIMWFPRNIRQISVRHHPSSSPFALFLAVHYNRNQAYVKKHGEAVITVKKVLENTQEIPTYDVVKSATGAVFQRIIKPFIRDMDELVTQKILKSWYITIDNFVVNRDGYKNLKYDSFESAVIHYTFVNYPIKQIKQ